MEKHIDTIKQVIDSFRKMCDYIETDDKIGCGKCPVFKDCYYNKKHTGLRSLMDELDNQTK